MEYLAFPWEVKEADLRPDGSFQGIASPFGGIPDEGGDIVEHGAFAKTIQEGGRNKNGIWPFLWYHSSRDVQGLIDHVAEKRIGLEIGGRYALETTRGHDSYILAKMGAATQLSMGYDPVNFEMDEKKKIRKLKEVKLWEVSQVVFGMAGSRAEITSMKAMDMETELSFDGEIEIPSAEKPYPNEHACRLNEPGKYVRFVRKNNAGKVDGKRIDHIYGFKKGGGSELQAIRYPKDEWESAAARKHCSKQQGKFEAAGEKCSSCVLSIEEAKTERELERALRDGGLSISAAKYLVSMCRSSLREAERKGVLGRIGRGNLEEVLENLQKVRAEMEVYGNLYL